MVGLIVFQSANPFFAEVARGADQATSAAGLVLLQGNSERDSARENSFLELFEQQRVRGVLLSPAGAVPAQVVRLRERGIPVVLVDRDGSESGVSSVSVDDIAGGRLAVQHLLDQGCRRITFLAAHFDIRQISDRLTGARQAVAATSGAQLEIVTVDELDGRGGRSAGEQLIRRPPANRPDGVFAVNDLLAVGFLQAVVSAQTIRVPEEIAVVGYDDIDFAATAIVPISSIRQPAALMGERAMEILLEESQDSSLPPRQFQFAPGLVARRSSVGE